MLTPLQVRVAHLVSALEEATEFALAGGAALIARGHVTRSTEDLDFFATAPEHVSRLLPSLEEALVAEGLRVERIRDYVGYARLRVDDLSDSTTIDLCWDSRLFPPEPSPLGLVLSGEELAASKLLALFTRAQPRDFVDVVALSTQFGFDRLCELAAEKDRGFNLPALADALGSFRGLRREAFPCDDDDFDRLRRSVGEWRSTIVARDDR